MLIDYWTENKSDILSFLSHRLVLVLANLLNPLLVLSYIRLHIVAGHGGGKMIWRFSFVVLLCVAAFIGGGVSACSAATSAADVLEIRQDRPGAFQSDIEQICSLARATQGYADLQRLLGNLGSPVRCFGAVCTVGIPFGWNDRGLEGERYMFEMPEYRKRVHLSYVVVYCLDSGAVGMAASDGYMWRPRKRGHSS